MILGTKTFDLYAVVVLYESRVHIVMAIAYYSLKVAQSRGTRYLDSTQVRITRHGRPAVDIYFAKLHKLMKKMNRQYSE